MTNYIQSHATLSNDDVYRFTLTRGWGDGGRAVFVMLNPSTADAMKDDPTIRRCIGFAKREGMGSMTVVNLFAYRATNPDALLLATDPIGPHNDDYMREALSDAELKVAAWGSWWESRPLGKRPSRTTPECMTRDLMCLGMTKNGSPRHPLYVKADTQLQSWSAP